MWLTVPYIRRLPGMRANRLPMGGQALRRCLAIATSALTAATLSGCTLGAPPSGAYPHYNEVYGIATHNSYWINRSDQYDYYSSGTQELLSDQLLQDHVRALEIDVHAEGAPWGRWKVYHTSDSEDFSCRYLDDCLQMLRNFHYAVPRHEVINVVVELENTATYTGRTILGVHTHNNFADDHTIQQFDATFTQVLGPALYTPKDFLSRPLCSGATITMVECAAKAGWPTIDQLRGRFIVNILGNWSTAAYDWVQYASGDMRSRVAFPMQSVFGVEPTKTNGPPPCGDHTFPYKASLEAAAGVAPLWFSVPDAPDGHTYWIKDIFDATSPGSDVELEFPSPPIAESQRQVSFRASVFWQLEALCTPGLELAKAFFKSGGVIRGADSYDYQPTCNPGPVPTGSLGYGRPGSQCQEDRIAAGFQMIQTDYPWHFVQSSGPGIPTDPSQRFKPLGWFSGPPVPIREPGGRLYFHTPGRLAETWAYVTVPTTSRRWWEATVSTTRLGDTWGETTHDGLILDDRLKSCPQPGLMKQDDCTNYPRQSSAEGEGSIRVGSADGSNWMMISRQKSTTDGASYYQEGVHLYIRFGHDGQVPTENHLEAARYGTCLDDLDPNSDGVTTACIGSMIAMSVDNQGTRSVVTAYSAGRLLPSGMPDWKILRRELFDSALTKQGYSARTYPDAVTNQSDVLFAGPRMGASAVAPESLAVLHNVTLNDLPRREVLTGSRATIVDLSAP